MDADVRPARIFLDVKTNNAKVNILENFGVYSWVIYSQTLTASSRGDLTSNSSKRSSENEFEQSTLTMRNQINLLGEYLRRTLLEIDNNLLIIY